MKNDIKHKLNKYLNVAVLAPVMRVKDPLLGDLKQLAMMNHQASCAKTMLLEITMPLERMYKFPVS